MGQYDSLNQLVRMRGIKITGYTIMSYCSTIL
jgi:hypothetical protein